MKKICVSVPDEIFAACEKAAEQMGCSVTAFAGTAVQLFMKQPKKIQENVSSVLSSDAQKLIGRYASELKITPDQFIEKLISSYSSVMSFHIDWRKTHGI